MQKKIILTGVSGFLGSNFCHFYKNGYSIIGCYHYHPVEMEGIISLKIDLGNMEEVHRMMENVQPEAVIHLAANSNPNDCEKNQEQSYYINVLTSANLAAVCARARIPFIFASTDLVFDGEHAPYSETDSANPLSIYGKHKLEAEKRISDIYSASVVCRLPLMYGATYASGISFIQPVLDNLAKGRSVRLFTDEYRTVASAREICEGLIMALEHTGITIHLGGNERLSRFEIGEKICEIYGYDKNLLIPSLQKDVVMAAPRPRDVSLNNSLARSFGWKPTSFVEEIRKIAKIALPVMLLLLSFIFPVKAQKLKTMPHTLLWKIEGKSGTKPSYLYGTMHTENDKAFHFMDSVMIAFNSCPSFAMEIDADSLEPNLVLSEITMPEGQTISSMLSQQEYDSVGKYFTKATGMPLSFFDNIRPIYLWVMITQTADTAKSSKGLFLDMFFFKLAHKQNKEISGLEKPEDQFKLFRDIPLSSQIEMLKESVKHVNENRDLMNENLDAYEKADFEVLMKDMDTDTSFGKDFSGKFITLRNHGMADHMEELMKKQPVFVAVGAGHLPGEEGVIQLLRSKGYKVRPVISRKRLDPGKVKQLAE